MSQKEGFTTEQLNLLAEAASLTEKANALWEEQRYAQTEALYRQALSLEERARGTDHPDTASAFFNLVRWLEDQRERSFDRSQYPLDQFIRVGLMPAPDDDQIMLRINPDGI